MDPGRLLNLHRRERAIGRHHARLAIAHSLKCFRAPLHRQREKFVLHRPGTVVRRARVDGGDFEARNLAHQVARAQPQSPAPFK